MPKSIDQNTKRGRMPPIQNNLSEQIKLLQDSTKTNSTKMNKSNTSLTYEIKSFIS
jgi:hypothetical protein